MEEQMKQTVGKRRVAGGRKLLGAFAWSLGVTLCVAFTAAAQEMVAHHHIESESDAIRGNSQQRQDWARARLAKSPRHQEWIDVKSGNRTVKSFVVYPEIGRASCRERV